MTLKVIDTDFGNLSLVLKTSTKAATYCNNIATLQDVLCCRLSACFMTLNVIHITEKTILRRRKEQACSFYTKTFHTSATIKTLLHIRNDIIHMCDKIEYLEYLKQCEYM